MLILKTNTQPLQRGWPCLSLPLLTFASLFFSPPLPLCTSFAAFSQPDKDPAHSPTPHNLSLLLCFCLSTSLALCPLLLLPPFSPGTE